MERKGMKELKELFCEDGKLALKWKRVAGIAGGTGILAVLFLMVKKLRKRRKWIEQSEMLPSNEDSADREQTMEEE